MAHRRLLFAALWLTLSVAALAQAPQTAPPERKPAAVMNWSGADWLEREGREEEQRPDLIVRTMKLREGEVVADIGAGTGYFTRRLGKAVGRSGRVNPEDIQPEMLALLRKNVEKAGLTNVIPVLGAVDDPKLPKKAIDWILLVDVYHELQRPEAMLARMREILKPSGKVALVEYRLEGTTALHVRVEHRMSVKQILAEWQHAGFRLVRQYEFLPTQHFFVFERAPDH
jgi:ubiquinone/menaquinone biosynthesis C-methylase UbiE